jgi:hypothetical protein
MFFTHRIFQRQPMHQEPVRAKSASSLLASTIQFLSTKHARLLRRLHSRIANVPAVVLVTRYLRKFPIQFDRLAVP